MEMENLKIVYCMVSNNSVFVLFIISVYVMFKIFKYGIVVFVVDVWLKDLFVV